MVGRRWTDSWTDPCQIPVRLSRPCRIIFIIGVRFADVTIMVCANALLRLDFVNKLTQWVIDRDARYARTH